MKIMGTERRELGRSSEDEAVLFLRRNGFRVLERNYRCRLGEVDIVARDGDYVVFVEVRSSRTGSFVHPKYSIGPRKMRTIGKVALNYLKEKGLLDHRSRFDVVTVVKEGEAASVEWMKSAFELTS